MAADTAHGTIVLFGGLGQGPPLASLADTWLWNGTTWTQAAPATSPSARLGHAMAYDSFRHRVVLFGGAGGGFLNDTWEWDGTTWANVTPAAGAPSPSPRTQSVMTYDAQRHRIVLFGGMHAVAGSPPVLLGDTWEWDGTSWTQATPATAPSARDGQLMVYDDAQQRVVLYGGFSAETWLWDGTSWTHVTPASSPPPAAFTYGAYDAARQRVVLFGGIPTADTWEWDGTTWTKAVTATSPSARQEDLMAYDSARQEMVLFGGRDRATNGLLNDTWIRSGPTLSGTARVGQIRDGLPTTAGPFRDARKKLDEALKPNLWSSDGTELAVPKGQAFFDKVRDAVDRLRHLRGNDTAQQATTDLWNVALQLTNDAIAHAQGGNPREVSAALKERDKAIAQWAGGHDDAFDHLKQAWKHAENALK